MSERSHRDETVAVLLTDLGRGAVSAEEAFAKAGAWVETKEERPPYLYEAVGYTIFEAARHLPDDVGRAPAPLLRPRWTYRLARDPFGTMGISYPAEQWPFSALRSPLGIVAGWMPRIYVAFCMRLTNERRLEFRNWTLCTLAFRWWTAVCVSLALAVITTWTFGLAALLLAIGYLLVSTSSVALQMERASAACEFNQAVVAAMLAAASGEWRNASVSRN
jgi:hypothetical protein